MNPRPRWLVPVIVVAAVLLVIVAPLVSSYNGLVDKDTKADQAFADLDAALQRRYDLIPNIVSTAKAALNQEQAVFGQLAEARTRYAGAGSADAKVAAGQQVESAIGRLLVVVENYPELRSNQTLQDVMTQLEGTENRVAQGRRQYNEAVTDYNRSVRRFPKSIVAGLFGFDKRTLFQVQATSVRDAPQVDFGSTTTTTAG
ncbi:MAG: LemA protein [Actinomycetia bacterium]|jgi:LemA protein|nr:LemA protein [Actinomycetes bacterium]